MTELVRFPRGNARQIISFNRFEQLTGTKVFICIDRGILNIMRYLLNTRGTWPTTYSVSYAGDVGYYPPTDEQMSTLLNTIGEANEDMSTCEEITTELSGIKDAILSLVEKPCCPSGSTTGSRGTGSSQPPLNTYDQAETPTTPPPGFDDMQQYWAHKCLAANDIINNLISDLQGLSGVVYSGATPVGIVGALVLFLLTPIPFDELIALAAYLIYSAYSYTFLSQMSGAIDDGRADLLCTLYDSPSAEVAQTNFLSALEAISEAQGWAVGTPEWVMGAIDYMLGAAVYNVMFENIPTVSTQADCDNCACTPLAEPITIDTGYGTLVSFEDGVMTVAAQQTSGYGCGITYQISIYNIPDGFKITGYEVVSGSLTKCTGTYIWNVYEGLGAPYQAPESHGDTLGLPQGLGTLFTLSRNPHTIAFSLCYLGS